MDGRKRTVQLKFRVTEAERDLILEKMKLIPTRNMAVIDKLEGNDEGKSGNKIVRTNLVVRGTTK